MNLEFGEFVYYNAMEKNAALFFFPKILTFTFRKINNDPETRYKMYASDRLYPFLDMYYQVCI